MPAITTSRPSSSGVTSLTSADVCFDSVAAAPENGCSETYTPSSSFSHASISAFDTAASTSSSAGSGVATLSPNMSNIVDWPVSFSFASRCASDTMRSMFAQQRARARRA